MQPIDRRGRAVAIISTGIVAAVVGGVLHAVLLAVWALSGHFTWVSRDYVWMSPLAAALVLVPGSVTLAALVALWRGRGGVAAATGVMSTVLAFGLLLPLSEVSRAAALVLATGLGVAVARLVFTWEERWVRSTPRAAALSVLCLGVLAGAQDGWRRWRESRALGTLAPAPPGAPNVLLVVLDAARARDVGFVTPAAATTPRLDRRAVDGAVFTNAFSVGPWTLPSHASMLSGRYASELAADWTVPVERSHPVLPELLRARGYATGAFVANLHYTAWDSGLLRGFAHVDDYPRNAAMVVRSTPFTQTKLADTLLRGVTGASLRALAHPDLSMVRQHRYQSRLGGEVIDAFLAWRVQQSRPWFAMVNLMDPHLVTTADTATRRRYPHDDRGLTDYRAAIQYLDGELDRLLQRLADDGTLDSTLVIVTADHGELLGEHGLHGHAQSLYRDVAHVPLLIRFPRAVPPAVVSRPVSLRDLAATVLDLTGVESNALPGHSLRAAWDGSRAKLSAPYASARQQPNPLGQYPTASGDLSAVFDAEWSYIRNHGTGGEELFAVEASGGESADLVADARYADRLAVMRAAVDSMRRVLQPAPRR